MVSSVRDCICASRAACSANDSCLWPGEADAVAVPPRCLVTQPPPATPGPPELSRVPASRLAACGPDRRSPAPWRAIGTGAGIAAGEGLTGYLHPAVGEFLASADIIGPAVIAVLLFIVILRGSEQTVERTFRLLRWIANRPEPPGPS